MHRIGRYTPHLAALAALTVFVTGVLIIGSIEPEAYVPTDTSVAELPALLATTTTPLEPKPLAVQKIVPPEPSEEPLITAAVQLRKALVNIICDAPRASGAHSISGSGIVVSSTGMILTNAHVAQHYLLADRGVTCKVRTGSPATDTYTAALAYLSPAWVKANPTLYTEATPSGTGEYDFALLAITGSATTAPAPTSFAFAPLATAAPGIGQPVAIASYGAQDLSTEQITSKLHPTIVLSTVEKILTFEGLTPDVLVIDGSPAAQHGSSGGGVADAKGSLIGVITTSKTTGPVAERSLTALASTYLRAQYLRETGRSLNTLLATPLKQAVADFAPQAEVLRAILENAAKSE